jgi:hypothetical protein
MSEPKKLTFEDILKENGKVKLFSPIEAAVKHGFLLIRNRGNNDWESEEFAFFVLYMNNGDFAITIPFSNGTRHGVKIASPKGFLVKAYCHSHPKSTDMGKLQTSFFSADDKEAFNGFKFPVPFFLMTHHGNRVANAESQFPAGLPFD